VGLALHSPWLTSDDDFRAAVRRRKIFLVSILSIWGSTTPLRDDHHSFGRQGIGLGRRFRKKLRSRLVRWSETASTSSEFRHVKSHALLHWMFCASKIAPIAVDDSIFGRQLHRLVYAPRRCCRRPVSWLMPGSTQQTHQHPTFQHEIAPRCSAVCRASRRG